MRAGRSLARWAGCRASRAQRLPNTSLCAHGLRASHEAEYSGGGRHLVVHRFLRIVFACGQWGKARVPKTAAGCHWPLRRSNPALRHTVRRQAQFGTQRSVAQTSLHIGRVQTGLLGRGHFIVYEIHICTRPVQVNMFLPRQICSPCIAPVVLPLREVPCRAPAGSRSVSGRSVRFGPEVPLRQTRVSSASHAWFAARQPPQDLPDQCNRR